MLKAVKDDEDDDIEVIKAELMTIEETSYSHNLLVQKRKPPQILSKNL
jgi:hypothetical protein